MTRRELILSIVIGAALVAAVFHQVTIGGRTLSTASTMPSAYLAGSWQPGATFESLNTRERIYLDTVLDPAGSTISDEPSPHIARRQYAAGHLPWLNPGQAMGHPLAADMMSGVFNPLQLLPMIHPSDVTWNIYLLLRVWLLGWFTYLFLRRHRLAWPAALAAGMMAAFGGYTIWWVNLFHLSVDLWLPFLLLCVEAWLQTRGRRWLAGLALGLAAAFLGGNPQPLILMLGLVAGYAIVRVWMGDRESAGWASLRMRATSMIALGAALALGLGLAAVLILPFIELLRVGFHFHTDRTAAIFVPSAFRLTWLFPNLFTLRTSHFLATAAGESGGGGYMMLGAGLMAFPLMLAGLCEWRRRPFLIIFFGAAWLLSLLKLIGFPGTDILARLPLITGINFTKYVIVFFFAQVVLAGVGVEGLLRAARRETARRERWFLTAALALGVLVPLALLYEWFQTIAPAVTDRGLDAGYYDAETSLTYGDHLQFTYQAYMALGLAALAAFAAACWIARPRWLAPVLVCAPLLAECLLNTHRPWPARVDTYVMPPYAAFIKAREASQPPGRVWATGSMLTPFTASVYGLEDLRHFEALLWKPYYDMMKRLVTDEETNLFYNYTGSQKIEALYSPMLSVCNVCYVISDTSPNAPEVTKALRATGRFVNHPNQLPWMGRVQVGTRWRHALLVSYPAGWSFSIEVRDVREELRFFATVPPQYFYEKFGDGATLNMWVSDSEKKVLVWSRRLSPQTNPDHRRWHAARVKLGAFEGKTVTVLFDIDPGPDGFQPQDGLLLADFSFRSQDVSQGPYRLIYEDEIFVYENRDVLPRAFLAPSARVASSWDEMRQILEKENRQAALSPMLFASLDGQAVIDTLPGADEAARLGRRVIPAAVTLPGLYRRQYMVNAPYPGLLVISELGYPGWKARLNGARVPLVRPFGALQGVLIPAAGQHTIEMVYRPASILWGKAISLISLLGLAGWLWGWPIIQRRRAAAPQAAEHGS